MSDKKSSLSLHLRFTVGTCGPFSMEALSIKTEQFSQAILVAAENYALEVYNISTEIKTPKE